MTNIGDATESKPYWLSFSDERGFLGVAVVYVSERDAEEAATNLPTTAKPEARWVVAAAGIAHRLGCNPGGEVVGFQLTKEGASLIPDGAVGTLLQKEELKAYGFEIGSLFDHLTMRHD